MWIVRSGVSVDSHGWVPFPVPVSDYRAMTHSSSVAEIAVAVAAVVAAVGRHVWVTDLCPPYDYTHSQTQVLEQKKRRRRRRKGRGGLGGTPLDPGVRQS